jgi:hypothetical protein
MLLVRLRYFTSVGTATTAGYISLPATILQFQPGEVEKLVPATLQNDALAESHQTFSLNLDTPINAVIDRGYAQAAIIDNDTATASDLIGTATIRASDQPTIGTPIVSVDDITVGKSDTFATFTIRLSAPSASQTSVRSFPATWTATPQRISPSS